MKNITNTIAVAGANLLALGIAHGDNTQLQPHFSNASEPHQARSMSIEQMRAKEASHLEVYAGCKWGHAAFDPVKVDSEALSPEVSAIYSQLG